LGGSFDGAVMVFSRSIIAAAGGASEPRSPARNKGQRRPVPAGVAVPNGINGRNFGLPPASKLSITCSLATLTSPSIGSNGICV
jgi:hypothetical protein